MHLQQDQSIQHENNLQRIPEYEQIHARSSTNKWVAYLNSCSATNNQTFSSSQSEPFGTFIDSQEKVFP